jgi:hypothetical protein
MDRAHHRVSKGFSMDASNSLWHIKPGKFAFDFHSVPNTLFDPTVPLPPRDTIKVLDHLFAQLRCSPWSDALALCAGICVARGYPVPDVVAAVRCVDRVFWMGVRACIDADGWNAVDAIGVYRHSYGSVHAWKRRTRFFGDYSQLANELRRWHQALPADLQRSYRWIETFVPIQIADLAAEVSCLLW